MEYYAQNDYRNYISHHGVLGMKWGVRRYQNKDGTLTAEGRKRYGAAVEKMGYDSNTVKLSKRSFKKVKKLRKRMETIRKNKEKNEKHLEDFRRNPNKYLQDPKWVEKHSELLTRDEIRSSIDRVRLLNDVHVLKRDQLSQVKQYVDVAVSYGKTANDVLNLINSPVGRGVRASLGMGDKVYFDYGQKNPYYGKGGNNRNRNRDDDD